MAESISSVKRISEDDGNVITAKKIKCTEDSINSQNNEPSKIALDLTDAVSVSSEETNLSESDCGIKEYISDLPGFSGVIKARYSDFIVNEIDLEGNIVHFKHMDVPVEPKSTSIVTDAFNDTEIKLIEGLCNNSRSEESVIIEVTDKDKDTRRKIHEAIRNHFQGLDSKTESRGSSKVIVVSNYKTKSRKFHPPSRGNYTHFALYKENKDTMSVISAIAAILKIPIKKFSYAGTKDKRAKTTQLVTGYQVNADDLLTLNRKLPGIKIGNLKYKDNVIKLGDLSGNHFTIILRQMSGSPDIVEKAMSSLSSKGFINYYGMQRFGTTSVSTHSIGRALLQGKWKEAIDLILKPRTGAEDSNLAAVKKIWFETRNARKAYGNLRNKSGVEGQLLKGLGSNNPNDLVNSLNAVPRNFRLMYIHSYQSCIWNKVLSRRIKNHGMKVLVGDLVSADCKDDVDVEEDEETSTSSKVPPRYVTEDDMNNGTTIYDVVLPLPGHSILYPKNEIKEWYEEFLKDDGMDFDSFVSKVKTYSLSGSYRKIIAKPSEVKWEIIPYADVTQSLILSDFEVLQGLTLPPTATDGPHKALKMEFRLPSSCYATMAIREVLKVDTCLAAQKLLNHK